MLSFFQSEDSLVEIWTPVTVNRLQIQSKVFRLSRELYLRISILHFFFFVLSVQRVWRKKIYCIDCLLRAYMKACNRMDYYAITVNVRTQFHKSFFGYFPLPIKICETLVSFCAKSSEPSKDTRAAYALLGKRGQQHVVDKEFWLPNVCRDSVCKFPM